MEAVEWLSKAQGAGLKPEIITYNAVIDACAKSGDMEEAVEWLSKTQEARLKPNVIAYNAVINAFAESANKIIPASTQNIEYLGNHRNTSLTLKSGI